MDAEAPTNKAVTGEITQAREPSVYEDDLDKPQAPARMQTQRHLRSRHVQLMAIGGAIGIGLFVGIGVTLTRAGPIALLVGYIVYGLGYIWPLCLAVGEMTAWLPIRGSIFEMATRFVHPSFGFAMGWTYFYSATMLVCTEYSAVATVMQYWNTSVNPAVWIAMAMVVCLFLNLVGVRWYGESEFVMSSTKILLLVGLMLVTFITMCGGNPNGDAYGFRNWVDGNAFREYHSSGDLGRFLAFFVSFRYAVFTVGGPDYISLSAGEIQNPRRVVPRVAKLIVWRIVGFYVLGVAFLGIICNSQDPTLISAIEDSRPGAAASPWVVGIKNVGIHGFLPGLINFLILLSGWSCGNAFLYTSSRTLYSLAQDGQAPKVFLRCTKHGIPWVCVVVVSLISCITFLVSSNAALEVFLWFVDLTTSGLIVNQTAMFLTFLGWYRALKRQGIDRHALPYRAPLAPYVQIFGLILGVLGILFIGFDRFAPFTARGFITSYFGIFWAMGLFIFWTVFKRTRFVNPETADVYGGKAEIDAECRVWEEGGLEENEKRRLAGMNVMRRTWEKMCLLPYHESAPDKIRKIRGVDAKTQFQEATRFPLDTLLPSHSTRDKDPPLITIPQLVQMRGPRACDRCHRFKEKCTSDPGAKGCQPCTRSGAPCTAIRQRPRKGRRPQAKNFTNGAAVRVWDAGAAASPKPTTPHAMASPIIASSTDSSLDDLCRAAFDGEPWQCTPELVRNFYRSFHRFLLGPSFASALRRVSQRAFYSSPPLLFDVYRAIADTMQDARESVGAPNEASIARGTSSLERLRTVDIAGEDDALAILALGQTLAAHDLLTNCNGCVLIMRYSLSCAEPWYGRLARDASLDPITTSTVFWDIVCCLVRGQMPVVKPQVREEGAVDRLAGLCTTMLPILYDLAVALNKASAARTGGAEAETTSFRNIEAMLRAWTPTPPENFDKRYTEVERLRMRAQASMYRSAALLVAHRAMHEFGTADDIARAHANHILHELSTHEELLGPDLCLRHIGFPLFTVAVEVPELSSSLLHKIDLLDVAPTARQQMGALVDYVWAQRNSGFRGYLHQLVQRGPTFVAVP